MNSWRNAYFSRKTWDALAGTRLSRELRGNAWRERVFPEKYVGMHGWGAFFSRNTWECMAGVCFSREIRAPPRIHTRFSRNTRPRHAFPLNSREIHDPAMHSHVSLEKYASPPCIPTSFSRNTLPRHAFPRNSREIRAPAMHSHVFLEKYAPPPCIPT